MNVMIIERYDAEGQLIVRLQVTTMEAAIIEMQKAVYDMEDKCHIVISAVTLNHREK